MPKALLLAFAAVVCLPAIASAEQFTGLTQAAIDGTWLTKILSDPLTTVLITIVISLVSSRVLKIDLSAFLVPLINSLLKPPGTPPVTTPTVTVPATPATPIDLTALLKLLVETLTKARAEGDKAGEDAALLMLNRLSGAK